MLKKATSGVLSRSASSRTDVRSGLPAEALREGWGLEVGLDDLFQHPVVFSYGVFVIETLHRTA
jgi:hypothetical protein